MQFSQPRPQFPLKEGQEVLGPLLLDSQHKEGRGGLLGDDMGLGKTIQVIAFLSAIMKKQGTVYDLSRRRQHVSNLQDKPDWKKHRRLPKANAKWPTCLIISPSSVVGNWEREFETWGYFEAGMYIGIPSSRADILNEFKLGRLDVLVTSFDVARMDIELLDDLPWSVIFIDEVHRVKNPTSKLAEAFSKFKCSCRFGLSGTVIQNGYEELWTVLNWTNPGAAGSRKQWKSFVEHPLRVGQSRSATDDQHIRAALVAKTLTEKILPQLFLRRTKDIIKNQLPTKTDQVVFCPLTSKQLEVYKRIINLPQVLSLVCGDRACECGSKKARKKCCHPVHPGDLFKYMSTLIKISNHLVLILPAPTDTTDQIARNRELSKTAFPSEVIPKYGPAMLRPEYCGKWQVLDMLLKEWRQDVSNEMSNKVLIFTKSVKLLEMLAYHLEAQSYGFVKLDGSTKQSDRMPMIDRFQQDPKIFIFLISTMAGGTGLNLTAANKVVIFDPAHDLQAMDRAYRFGQTRDVAVYRLLGAGSIEELIYARQVYKQQQMQVGYNASLQTRYFEGVQGDKSKQGELFGIKNIFKLHERTLATKLAIESANVSDLDWAFAYMGAHGGAGAGATAKRAKAKKPAGVQWVYEEEAKTGREYDDLRGLGALLFDDSAPDAAGAHEPDDIERTLGALGVQYTHRNDDLIAENAIEGERMRKLIEDHKKKLKQQKQQKLKGKNPPPPSVWPPVRKHHKKPPTPEELLRIRQTALIKQGMLPSPEDIPKFAEEFKKKTQEEQIALLKQLDDYAKEHNLK
ncbi:P-loop containing nucleoside triphosphate hydrolase protein [Epithele typhae]|uniref:P-loop containing nucleoside triphosphate hydrolase protein n=1 Tax=Epithele typhae TaxID=378194 RepID=UPI00200779D3|nr:P-loop containing nucleoside triphosphate hydrolase protein [Epithele typhae]KAH9922295.1 P-loop containing nucleoside triphosphate hydrolase protein [Epithele typhae]